LYFAVFVALFCGLPRLTGPYMNPWDCWWVFVLVMPTAAAGLSTTCSSRSEPGL
jgi:hypothetical protein